MGWIDSIEEFLPSNEQENNDKKVILIYINMFDDILKRDNEIIHVTSCGFVINKDKDKVLMVHHNIFNSWSVPGGHSDGEENLLGVALREVKEETGITDIIPISNKIVSLDILPVFGHFRKGKYISSHLHISVAYLVQADENSAVKWIPINDINMYSSESHMKKIYDKIISSQLVQGAIM